MKKEKGIDNVRSTDSHRMFRIGAASLRDSKSRLSPTSRSHVNNSASSASRLHNSITSSATSRWHTNMNLSPASRWQTNFKLSNSRSGVNSTLSTTSGRDENSNLLTSQLQSVSDSWNETVGGRVELKYISQEVRRIVEPILKVLSETKSKAIIRQVSEIVSVIVESVMKLNQSNFDASNLPPLTATTLDDGSFLIEWLFLNYRVGFVVEADPKESIWYLISRQETSDSNSSGSLAVSDKKEVLRQLVYYVAMNS